MTYQAPGGMVIDFTNRLFLQTLEMQEACKFLYRMRKFDPVIAGGALWSWAAGKRPNDIDVFVGDRHGLVDLLQIAFEENPGGSDSLAEPRVGVSAYRNIPTHDGQYDIHRFKHQLKINDYAIPVDLVVTPWRGIDPIWHFDYDHCRVAFGATHRNMLGADCYAKGRLSTCHHKPRPEEKIRGKLQMSLWGNPDATTQLQFVMEQLDHAYKIVAAEASP